MEIRAFHVKEGDSVLISSGDSTILVDGGLSTPFRDHVIPELAGLDGLDLVLVSHIDNDHISGILDLIRLTSDWRVFDFHSGTAGSHLAEPALPKPPEIAKIWHNGFHKLVDDADGRIQQSLELDSQILGLSGTNPALLELYQNLTTGVASALELNYRLELSNLGIPLNPESDRTDELLVLSDALETHGVGDFTLRILGPTTVELESLREEWNRVIEEKIAKNKPIDVESLRREAEDAAVDLGVSADRALAIVLAKEAEFLGQGESRITEPNVASLTALLDDGKHTVLLTGDARSPEILDGLRRHELITVDSGLHVDVLKVQHHGAAGNVSDEFCRFVTADHYLFCANGRHTNPEKVVLDGFLENRIGDKVDQNLSPVEANRPFNFWFTSHSTTPGITTIQQTFLESVEAHLDTEWAGHDALFRRIYPITDPEGDGISVTLKLED